MTRTKVAVVAFVVWLSLSVDAGAAGELSRLFELLDLGEPPQPKAAPDFTLPLLSGGSVTLKELQGKPVLIHFWTTWCQPCKWELPLLEKLYRQHKDRGLVVLAVSIDQTADVVKKFVAAHDLTFPVALDPERTVADRFRLAGLPGTFIVGPDGYLKARGHGPREWDRPEASSLVTSLLPKR